MTREQLPLHFREREVRTIMDAVAAGESCMIVGVGSVGKSNLLRFLQREDVHDLYLGDHDTDALFVYVDANKMLELSMWGMMELMLHQLLIELTGRGESQIVEKIDSLHERATQPETRLLTLRYLDRAIRMIIGRLGLTLVFLCDEFDMLAQHLTARAFNALRALRDDYKYRLTYVAATRMELKRALPLDVIEPLEELLTVNVVWLGPYQPDDARLMLGRLSRRHDVEVEEPAATMLLAQTGGHPGLLRAAFHETRQLSAGETDQLEMKLRSSPRVRDECRRIWLSLDNDDHKTLAQIIAANALPHHLEAEVVRLRQKGIIGGPWVGRGDIFSPLFAHFIKDDEPEIGARLHVDTSRKQVTVDGRPVEKLAPLEYLLIEYLYNHKGEVCSRDDILKHLYPKEMEDEGVSDNRLDSVLKRLRQRVEPEPSSPQFIITVHGLGLRLFPAGQAPSE